MRKSQAKAPQSPARGESQPWSKDTSEVELPVECGFADLPGALLESTGIDYDSAPWTQAEGYSDLAPPPGRRPPPSLREKQKWRAHSSRQTAFCPSEIVLDVDALPVISAPAAEAGGPTPAYITRSLFQDKHALPHRSGGSNQGIINSTVASKYIGVQKEVFEDSMLAGCKDCDDEYSPYTLLQNPNALKMEVN
ncbi:hypothetical protein R1sor_004105 [Riccia sorocarpa]|uniref:Uncharacterized protein n=1 Tax=Riccia sorocarpa TaxID=122646 RepID=A0ABD3H3V5_9MARC